MSRKDCQRINDALIAMGFTHVHAQSRSLRDCQIDRVTFRPANIVVAWNEDQYNIVVNWKKGLTPELVIAQFDPTRTFTKQPLTMRKDMFGPSYFRNVQKTYQ